MRRWCWHKWSKWFPRGEADRQPEFGSTYKADAQDRMCTKCNKIQRRWI